MTHERAATTHERNVVRSVALQQLLQSGSFAGKQLSAQRGVSFIQSLQSLCTSTRLAILHHRPFSTDAGDTIPAESRSMLCKLGGVIPETFTATIPCAAFLALAYILLVDDGENYARPENLQRANQLCKQSELHTTLPMIAVCCFQLSSLEHVLQRFRDSRCALDDGTPSSSVTQLIEQTRKEREDYQLGRILPLSAQNHLEERITGNIHFRGRQATPLSIFVARNDMYGIKILLKLGASTELVRLLTAS